MKVLEIIVALGGLASMIYGCWLAWPPLAYIVAGYWMTKAAAAQVAQEGKV